MGKLWRRLYWVFNRRRLEQELAEEMQAHRELLLEGRRAHFGSDARHREDAREAWSWAWLEQLKQDLAYGARVLYRAPAFTLGAIAVLALGVGVNLAELQIFDGMIFHRLHFRDADAFLEFSHVSKSGQRIGFPPGAVDFYLKQSRSFAWLALEEYLPTVVEGDAGLRSTLVSPGYFSNVAIVPAWGRLLDAHDAAPGAEAVAVLSYSYWQKHWGSDPRVVGRAVHVNGQLVQVIGVAPYDFDGLSGPPADLWLPVVLRPLLLKGSAPIATDFAHETQALFGKLGTGVTQAAGEGELTMLTRELAARHQAFEGGERIQGEFVQASMSRRAGRSPAFFIFLVMVLLVLLSACANLCNMLLARGLVRQREIQIRLAIGASRARVVRQLITENLVLAALGTAGAFVFGQIAGRLLLNALGAPVWLKLTVTWPIVATGIVLTLISTVAFGVPAATQTVCPSPRKVYLRQILVGVQVAVSCLLLIASGVLVHSGLASAAVDMKFDYRNMVVVSPQLFARNLTKTVAQSELQALRERLGALPGVDGVTVAVVPPLGRRLAFDSLPGLPRIYRNAVADDYFKVMGLAMAMGRTFSPGETNALVVSESAARAVWPNEQALGKKLDVAGATRTVVGVVRDSGANLLADTDSVEAYVQMGAGDADRSALILHTRVDPAPLVRVIAAAAAELKETVEIVLMRASRETFLEGQRRMTTLIGSIGAVATVLACAGMFAMVSFAVAQRRRELGIRIAIGAGPRHILQVLLAQHLMPAGLGVAAGVALAAVLSRLVRSLVVLQKNDGLDVLGFAGGIVAFVLVAVLATLSPARRALRIDPSVTLREE